METIKRIAFKNGFMFELPDSNVIIPFSSIIAVFYHTYNSFSNTNEGKIEYLGSLNDDHCIFVFKDENFKQFRVFIDAYSHWLNKE